MTLKELIHGTAPEKVINELLLAYPESLADKHHYLEVIDYIKATPSIAFDEFVINIALIDPENEEDYEEDIDEAAYISISGYSIKEDLHFALGFTRWEEWANAQIVLQEDLEINTEELIAILIYEMTFYGFNQDEIANELKEMESGMMMH